MTAVQPVPAKAAETALDRRTLWSELGIVLALSFATSAVYAVLSIIRSALRGPLGQQTSTVVSSQAPNPWLDLVYQLVGVTRGILPVLLVAHLMLRGGESLGLLGLDRKRPVFDASRGAALAAIVGGTGLAFYLLAYNLGLNTSVAVTTLGPTWWRDPVLVLGAFQNSLAEEVVVLGYVMRRLQQLGWSWGRATVFSSLLRGTYHLYQGFGGFVGNAVMGVLFCFLFRRWGRVTPFVVAHTLIDVVAFVGYAELNGRVSWLP